MKTSISSQSLNGEFSEKLSASAAAGFQGIELHEQDFRSFGGTPQDMKRMVHDHGLTVAAMVLDLSYEAMPDLPRRRALDLIERRFDRMAALDCALMVLGSATDAACLGGVDRMAGDLAALGQRAAARGVRIGYEAQAWGRHVCDYRDAWEIVRRAGHAAVGLVLDSFHTLARGTSPESIRAIPSDRIFHVQIADTPQIGMDIAYLSRHFRCPAGEGDLPLAGFLRAVAATGYDGWLGSEASISRSRANARSAARDAHRALLFLADQAGRGEASSWLGALRVPPRAKINGVEFVEFTADHAEAEALGKLLAQIGFAQVARHQGKDVRLWRQAGINIVINCENRGYAHSARVMHGTSVCDIGLLVDDAAAAAARAHAFGANDFAQARGKGELAIPAVRGVGGSVLHFLDRNPGLSAVWDTEFRPIEPVEATGPAVGLDRIDHVAQVMNREELLSWTLLYSAVFDLAKAPEVSVADPGGLVASRALKTAGGSARFTLNGVDTHHTFAGRFVSDSYGSSVQHLAFSTPDIFGTVRALVARGLQTLPVSEDYYAELGPHFGLAPEFVAQLAENNLFYDEDDQGGSYLQLYSRPFGDGFFFEFVERRQGYDGYGAANAAYRTAALKRLAASARGPVSRP